MYIYVDESGPFVPPRGKFRVSAVGAVVVPESQRRPLLRALQPFLAPGTTGEVKGSTLDEATIARVLHISAGYDVFVQIAAVEMSLQTNVETRAAQEAQAQAITDGLTEEHGSAWHTWSHELRAAMERLSPQLYIQAMSTVELLTNLIETASMYYAQRIPRELATFRWRIDAKDHVMTPYEMLWSEIIMPFAESKGMRDPTVTLEAPSANYRYFERF